MAKLGLISPAIPFELALALGYSPSLILPSGVPISRAEGLLPRNFCAYLKLLAASLLQDNRWEAILVPLEDESHRRFFEVLEEMLPGRIFALELPLRKDEAGARRLAHLFRALADQLGREFNPDALEEAIVLGNELRRAVKEARDLWVSGLMDSLSFWDLRVKALTSSPPEAISLLRGACAESRRSPGSKPGIMLSGGVTVKRALVELVEGEGFRVVAEDSDIGDRFLLEEIPVGRSVEENLLNLARAYLGRPPSPRDLDPERRLQFYRGLIEARKAVGVIFSYYKFCDPALAEYPFIASHLKGRGIPCLLLEEEDESLSGQNRTRVQAFLEMVQCR